MVEGAEATKGRGKRARKIAVISAIALAGFYMLTQYRGHPTAAGSGDGAPGVSSSSPHGADQLLRPGEAIPMEGLSLVVEPAQIKTAVGFAVAPEPAAEGGILVVVRYAVTNTSGKPISAGSMPRLVLIDSQGTEYSPDGGKTAAYDMANKMDIKILSDLNPGITVRNAEVFEISKANFDPEIWRVSVNGKKVALK